MVDRRRRGIMNFCMWQIEMKRVAITIDGESVVI